MKSEKGKFIIGIILLALILILLFIPESLIKKIIPSSDNTYDYIKIDNKDVGNGSYDVYNLEYKNDYNTYFVQKSGENELNFENVNYKKIFTYYCQTKNCLVSGLENSKYLLTYDEKIYVLNMDTLEKKYLDIDVSNIKETHMYGNILSGEKVSYLIINYVDDKGKIVDSVLYSIDNNKVIFNSTNGLSSLAASTKYNVIIDNCTVRDLKTGSVINEFKPNNDTNKCSISINDKGSIIYNEYTDMISGKLYNKDYTQILSYNNSNMIFENDNIFVNEGTVFKKYDYQGNVLKTSKLYDNILYMYDKYFLAVQDGFLKLFDLDENELASITKWNNNKNILFPQFISINEKEENNIISIVYADKNLTESTLYSGYKCEYNFNTKKLNKVKVTKIDGQSYETNKEELN